MNYIWPSQLDRFDRNLAVVANLKQKEQLWIFGNRIIKIIDPASFFANSRIRIFQNLNKIISVSLTILFDFGKWLTRQNEKDNIEKVKQLLGPRHFVTNKNFNSHVPKKIYQLIDTLKTRQNNLIKANNALKLNFDESLHDFESTDILLGNQLETLEKKVFAMDTYQVKNLLKSLEMGGKNINHKEIRLSTANFTAILQNIYGKQAVLRALEYYNLDKVGILSGTDAIALIIGTVTHLTKSDFEGREEYEIFELLDKYRNIRFDCIKPIKTIKYRNRLVHDQKLLKALSLSDEYQYDEKQSKKTLKIQLFRPYGYTEFLARHLSYALQDGIKAPFPDGFLFHMHDSKGEKCIKQAFNIVSEYGLYGTLIKPLKPENEKNPACQLVFRGTSCFDSLLRDINPYEAVHRYLFDGPGRKSFQEKCEDIFSKTMSHLEGLENVELEFIGHSLGGSDSQRAMEFFTGRVEEKGPIRKLSLSVFNSPNIESDLCKNFIDNVKNLKGVSFEMHYFDIKGDIVQELGVKRLGFCGYKTKKIPKNLSISIVKFNRKLANKIESFISRTFSKIGAFVGEPVRAHTSYSLKYFDNPEKGVLNQTYIEDIFTNNPSEINLEYKKGFLSGNATKNELDYQLITNVGRLGKRINQKIHTLSCGYFGRSYESDISEEWNAGELRLIPVNK